MLLINDKNYYPFYKVDNFQTHSKFEALKHATQKNITDVRFYFHDEVFSCYDWTKEPTESLETLYKQRAEQLRNQYDYLILGFSGGSDSTAVLDAFIDNNIPLDEIVVYHTLKAEGDKNSFYNFETFNVAIPYLESKVDKTKTKITLIDQSDATIKYWSMVNKFDFVHYNSHCFSPNNLARHYVRITNAELQQSFDKSMSVGYITGIDKPCVVYDEGKAYFHFTDCIDTTVSYFLHDKKKIKHIDEFFFWTPNFPKIVCKQAHTIKRFYNLLDEQSISDAVQKNLLHKGVPDPLINAMKIQGKYFHPNAKLLAKLVYPKWNLDTPSVGKSFSGFVYSQRDVWFFKSNLPEVKIFNDSMQHYFENIHSRFMYSNLGIKPVITRLYALQ